ncbi:hypothetical protein [Intestinirhabdus alba]|jgi:hypothetical protein|uniref:Uncharacterized protein n=1 Tax=Intestinirhabdus alba TaxID=2899544 RepID=A0A6L6IJX5_9ENTR|nr:hypothetical protein [Intestinirhabdus alba]MTH46008.1 hypothetical protein [Intestinirhabdus alba]
MNELLHMADVSDIALRFFIDGNGNHYSSECGAFLRILATIFIISPLMLNAWRYKAVSHSGPEQGAGRNEGTLSAWLLITSPTYG